MNVFGITVASTPAMFLIKILFSYICLMSLFTSVSVATVGGSYFQIYECVQALENTFAPFSNDSELESYLAHQIELAKVLRKTFQEGRTASGLEPFKLITKADEQRARQAVYLGTRVYGKNRFVTSNAVLFVLWHNGLDPDDTSMWQKAYEVYIQTVKELELKGIQEPRGRRILIADVRQAIKKLDDKTESPVSSFNPMLEAALKYLEETKVEFYLVEPSFVFQDFARQFRYIAQLLQWDDQLRMELANAVSPWWLDFGGTSNTDQGPAILFPYYPSITFLTLSLIDAAISLQLMLELNPLKMVRLVQSVFPGKTNQTLAQRNAQIDSWQKSFPKAAKWTQEEIMEVKRLLETTETPIGSFWSDVYHTISRWKAILGRLRYVNAQANHMLGSFYLGAYGSLGLHKIFSGRTERERERNIIGTLLANIYNLPIPMIYGLGPILADLDYSKLE